jgi:hypothetical protein
MQDSLGQERLLKEKKQKRFGKDRHLIQMLTKEITPDKLIERSC